MSTSPTDLANRALDAIGVRTQLGDLQEGSDQAAPILRAYGPALRQISRSAHWNCLRRQAEMILLNDATGETTQYQMQQGWPVTVGRGTVGMRPWVYEYALPIDCVKARYVPMSWHEFTGVGVPTGNISLPDTPATTGQNTVLPFGRQRPARFLIGYDTVPTMVGAATDWSQIPDTSQTMGKGVAGQTVVLTNQKRATLIYTCLATYPDQWDPLFSEAFVALLASRIAMILCEPKVASHYRDEQIKIAKMALEQARISDGDEGWTTTDHVPDWLRVRDSGGWGYGSNNLGVVGYGWDSCSFGDGSAY